MSVPQCSSKEEQLQVLLQEVVQAANERSQFCQRDTELNAQRFVQTLVLGWLRQADASLNELAQYAQDLGIGITGSAIHERLGPAAIDLLGRVLMGTIVYQSSINVIDWNSDGTLLASAGEDAIIRIWDVETGEVIATFEGHEDEIIDLDWSPDDQLIATASRDGTVRIWEVDLALDNQ